MRGVVVSEREIEQVKQLLIKQLEQFRHSPNTEITKKTIHGHIMSVLTDAVAKGKIDPELPLVDVNGDAQIKWLNDRIAKLREIEDPTDETLEDIAYREECIRDIKEENEADPTGLRVRFLHPVDLGEWSF